MPSNELHHGYTLTGLFIEANWSRAERRWSRHGRHGETSGTWARVARKAYNKAHRKASRVQLSRYQTPVQELPSLFGWDQSDDWHWDDFRTEAGHWYEEKHFSAQCFSAQDYQDYMAEVYASGLS
jgi:hypothetical protein